MKILYPKPFSVIASEAAETETIPEWEEGSYSAGAKVVRSINANNSAIDVSAIDYIFEAAVDTGDDPLSGSLDWLNRGASEPYKAFDEFVSSQSAYASGSVLEIAALKIDGIFLARFNGSALLEVFDLAGDTPFFSREITAASHIYEPAVSWTTYFFRDLVATGSAKDTLIETPARVAGVRVRLTAQTGGFSLGKIIVGVFIDIGETRIAPSIGILDFSVKATDESGNAYLKERSYAKRGSFDLLIKTAKFDQAASLLATLRARPIVYIADDLTRFSSLAIYGFYRDFSMLLSGEIYCDCSLEIEGLT
jgi:hypothetical protein